MAQSLSFVWIVAGLATAMLLAASAVIPIAYAHEEDECPTTLDTLDDCVTHHWNDGQIHSKGVYNSLISKVNAAISTRDNGNTEAAINILEAFIHQVEALSSKQIDSEAAEHMIHHATKAIEDLESA
jgi:hypothetical protein